MTRRDLEALLCAAAGRLAQVRTDIFHLCGVLGHGLFGGFQHIVAVIRHGLADGAGLGLGGGDDLRRTLLGGADDLGLAHKDAGTLFGLLHDGLRLCVGRLDELGTVADDGLGLPQLHRQVRTDVVEIIPDLLHIHDALAAREASRGPVIGHVSPEAAAGGPIALVEEDDLIYINIKERRLEIVGVKGEKRTTEEMEEILKARKAKWQPKSPKYTKGTLKLFSEHAVSPIKGGYMM